MVDLLITKFWISFFISYLLLFNILLRGCETSYMIQKSSTYEKNIVSTESDRIFTLQIKKSPWQKCPKIPPYFKSIFAKSWHILPRKIRITSAKLYFHLNSVIPAELIALNAYVVILTEPFIILYLLYRLLSIGILLSISFAIRSVLAFSIFKILSEWNWFNNLIT